jgi:hypothetical protein
MHESDDAVERVPDDHTLRHEDLLDVVLQIASLRGRCHGDMRAIAVEARDRPTNVEHPSPTRDDQLVAAFPHLDQDTGIRALLREVALAWLPIGATRTNAVHAWIALLGQALMAERAAMQAADHRDRIYRATVALIRHGIECGEFTPEVDPAAEAALLVALVHGLAISMIADPAGMPAHRAVAMIDAYLAVRPRLVTKSPWTC